MEEKTGQNKQKQNNLNVRQNDKNNKGQDKDNLENKNRQKKGNDIKREDKECLKNKEKQKENEKKREIIEDDAIVSINDQSEQRVAPQDEGKHPYKFSNKNKVSLNGLNELIQSSDQDRDVKKKELKSERQLTKTTLVNSGIQNQSLEDISKNDNSKYDQFANKKTNYDESIYSTKKTTDGLTKEQLQQAERIAKEIEQKDSGGNRHLQEERGQRQQNDNDFENDEETMYSGVSRQPQNQTSKNDSQGWGNKGNNLIKINQIKQNQNFVKRSKFNAINMKINNGLKDMDSEHNQNMKQNSLVQNSFIIKDGWNQIMQAHQSKLNANCKPFMPGQKNN